MSQTSSGVLGATLDLRDAMQSLFDTHKDQIEHATTAADIERVVNAGKIAAFLTVEGGHTIDDDLRVMRMYYQLGIRSMTLTHSRNNNWADSATDEPAHNGLTDFGKEGVRGMNRLRMVVDVSYVADNTFYDALEVTTKPVILIKGGTAVAPPAAGQLDVFVERALGLGHGKSFES